MKSGYHQSKLLLSRKPLEQVLNDPNVPDSVKRKIRLVQEARQFAEEKLHLNHTKNYKSYVNLNRPYVSYIVRAAPTFELKPYTWSFPLVGALPYKGYFSKQEALEASKEFDPNQYDTYVRGASAYSTLGWFHDPILSSMMNYKDHDLVNLIIHETVHATLYIQSNADFNERLATFLGNKGAELFYQFKEGVNSPTLQIIQNETYDQKLFSQFISKALKDLESWYSSNKKNISKEKKMTYIKKMQAQFNNEILPKMKTQHYSHFSKRSLNNASLLSYKTYVSDLSDFEKLLAFFENDYKAMLKYCKTLESVENPSLAVKKQLELQTL